MICCALNKVFYCDKFSYVGCDIMNRNRIIVHALIKTRDGCLLTKRSKQETTFKKYWDIPGGLAEFGELPREAVIWETKEEVGLDIIPTIETKELIELYKEHEKSIKNLEDWAIGLPKNNR